MLTARCRYIIENNTFYDADGFKMDYGGHQSSFSSNVIVTKATQGECLGLASFKAGLGDAYYNNTCFAMGVQQQEASATGAGTVEVVGGVSQCDPAHMTMHDNYYASPRGQPAIRCGGTPVLVSDLLRKTRIGQGSTGHMLPSDAEILAVLKQHLQL